MPTSRIFTHEGNLMAFRLILKGRVQGVFCRRYCSRYGREAGIKGSASNLYDGSVQVLLDTDDTTLVERYIHAVKNNTLNIPFSGHIVSVDKEAYRGSIRGDYVF